MKKAATPVWLLVFLLLSAQEVLDFRNARWNMSKGDIKKSEKLDLILEKPDVLGYLDTYLGYPVLVFYVFDAAKFFQGVFSFQQDHVNKNQYIADYMKMKETCQARYGPPMQDDVRWKNRLFRKDPKDWGLAVSIGHLAYQTYWETDRSLIALQLEGAEHRISLALIFQKKIPGGIRRRI